MADYVLAAEHVGVYEIPLEAGTISTVLIEKRYGLIADRVQISVHDSTTPVYAKIGNNVAVKDPTSSVITTGTWMEMQTGYQDAPSLTIALISASDATVSVARS